MADSSIAPLRAALSDRFVIERELGAGGMATVYLARDVKHDRHVALKVLRPELSAALGAERFHAEIRVTARLTHPHILALYDSGEAAGMLYYVMPYVDGEALRARLARGHLPVEEALRIAREVSAALAYAHANEVVHRDIKPENILLQGGHALVADFGIARAVGAAGADRLTVTGLLLGTPLYMSPEQASGEAVIDGRSDVYSLACVLFEMLTGEAPFTGPTMQAVLTKRFTQSAPSAAAIRRDVPAAIDDALQRALARDPGERIGSAAQFADMIAAATVVGQPAAPGRARTNAGGSGLPCIAVLPFANMSADQDAEFFSDGITEEILNALAKLAGLRVIARTSSFAFKGRNVDVREIGRALGAGHVLEGSVRKAGSRLRITAQLIDATTGHHLWSDKFDRDMTDVFAVQDEVTGSIRDELSRHLLGIGEHRAQATPAIDAETYELFLRGRYLIDQRVEGMRAGMELLQQVVSRAPGYAPGHAALASAFATLGYYCALPAREAFGLARLHSNQALALDAGDPEGLVTRATCTFYHDWNWARSGEEFALAAAHAPNDWHALSASAFRLASIGRFDEAIAASRRSIALDPLNPSALVSLGIINCLARRHDDAIAACDKILQLHPGYSEAHRWRALSLHYIGRDAEALASVQAAVRTSSRHVWATVNLAMLHAHIGDGAAVATFDELDRRAATENVPAYARAGRYLDGPERDLDRWFDIMAQSVEDRDFWNVMNRVEPWLDLARHDERFDALCSSVGIPPLAL